MLECVLCQKALSGSHPEELWAEVGGERYPVCDKECLGLVKDNPVEILGPRVTLRYREGCERCAERIALWREVADRRPIRLRLEQAPKLVNCPELRLEGEVDPFTGEITTLNELLSWLFVQYPGFMGCC